MKTSIILWIVGVGFFILAYFFYLQAADFREKAELVTGSIVGFTQQGSEGTQNCSVVAYQTSSGETFQHFSNQCGFGQNIGDPIELYYDPADPESVQVKSFTSTWLAALLLGIPGAISAALGVLFLPRYTKILKNLTS